MRHPTLFSIVLLGSIAAVPIESPKVSQITRIDSKESLNLGPEESIPVQGATPIYSCDISRDNCGSITPNYFSVFIADGAFDKTDSTLFFVDVPSGGDGVFQIDPATCETVSGSYYSINDGTSQRGIGYDPENHHIWVGGWNDRYLNQHDATPPYYPISYNYVDLAIAGCAVDDSANYLFVATNSSPDMLHVYDITGGTLGTQLGAWEIPWQSASDGYDMAGMSFNDITRQLVMVNQYMAGPGIAREIFDFDISTGLTQVDYCHLDNTGYAWGIALIEDEATEPSSFLSYHPDISSFSPPYDIDEYGIPSVYPPYDLACAGGTEDCSIELWWSNGDEYDEVHVYRYGELIAILPGDATDYTDSDIYYNSCDPPLTYGVSGVIGPDESGKAECSLDVWPPYWTCIDFSYSDGGFTPGGVADWEWGEPSVNLYGNAWETNLQANYENNACGWLDSPFIRINTCGACQVSYTYMDVECDHDGWNLQISADGGNTWSVIHPYEGYDQGVPTGACEEGLSDSTYCGDGELEHVWFDLDELHGEVVKFRFLFESDSTNSQTGVIIYEFCFAQSGGHVVPVGVYCELLNPDINGDGVGDVHIGDYIYYSATFVNQFYNQFEYGTMHSVFASQSCPVDSTPIAEVGPWCVGTLPGSGSRTHYYRMRVPNREHLLDLNPWAVQVGGWTCSDGKPDYESMRGCFDLTLLPAREKPHTFEPVEGFKVEEIDEPPVF